MDERIFNTYIYCYHNLVYINKILSIYLYINEEILIKSIIILIIKVSNTFLSYPV